MSLTTDPLSKYDHVAAWHWGTEQAMEWWVECSSTHTWPKIKNRWATWSLSSRHCFHASGWRPDCSTSWLPDGTSLQVKMEQERREETGIYKLLLYYILRTTKTNYKQMVGAPQWSRSATDKYHTRVKWWTRKNNPWSGQRSCRHRNYKNGLTFCVFCITFLVEVHWITVCT